MNRRNLLSSRLVIFSIFFSFFSLGVASRSEAQSTVLSTTSAMSNANGTGTVTFNLENTNSYDVKITSIAGVTSSSSASVAVSLWYRTTPLSTTAPPGAISTANNWVQEATGTITGIANSTTTTTQPFLSNLNFIIPANTTYAIAVFATSQRYSGTASAPTPAQTISAGGLNFITGPNIGYGGGTPPAAPGNNGRGWIGEITFEPVNLTPCFGTPNAGTAAGPASVCNGASVNLTLTGASTGTGLGIQWESSPAGTFSWTPIPNGTSASLNVVQNGPTDYHAVVTCANGGGSMASNDITVGANPIYQCYCSPLTGATLHGTTANTISNVTIAGTPLNVSTTAAGVGGYTLHDPNVAANTATLVPGVTYTLTAGISNATYGSELWIDWDQNGTFDATEYTLLAPGLTSTASIYVPATALPGMTGMRLRALASSTAQFGATGACSNVSTGRETEDFVITVAPAVQCSGMPGNGGNLVASNTTVCNGVGYNLTVSNYDVGLGLQLSWESSPAGANNWATIAGTTGNTYSVSNASSDMDYRTAVTCTNTGDIAYSNTVTVTVTNPQIVTVIPATRCGTGSLTLTAQGDPGTFVNWYTSQTGGAPILTNNTTFTTPIINSTTTYWAAAMLGGSTYIVGRPAPATATNLLASPRGIIFNANQPFTLNTVTVYSTSANAGAGTIQVVNSAGTVIAGPIAVSWPGGGTAANPVPHVLTLGFQIPVGTNHRLQMSAFTTGGIAYETSVANTIWAGYTSPGNEVQLVGSQNSATGTSTTTYYYFYNWNISTGCEGARTAVTATITPAPAVTISATPNPLCAGSTATLSATSANSGYTYTWTPGGTGNSVSVSPTSTTEYTLIAQDNSTNCTYYDTVELVVNGAPANIATVASTPSVCVSGNVNLSLNPVPTSTLQYQWERDLGTGYSDISGANAATYSEAVTATATYRAKLICGGNVIATSTPATVTYSNPQLLSTTGATLCGQGSAALTATTSAGTTANWYANQTGGNVLATGNTFNTPILTTTTTYWAAAAAGASTVNVGKVQPTSATNLSAAPRGVVFNATQPFTLNTVTIFSTNATAGSGVIQLYNSAGTVIGGPISVSWTGGGTAASPVPHVLTLNLPVPVGTGHKLIMSTFSTGGIAYETGQLATAWPGYTSPGGEMVMTGSATSLTAVSTTTYYYFYNWSISVGCESPRQAVTATVNPGASLTVTATPDSICLGSSAMLNVSSTNPNYTYTWTPGGAAGSSITVSPAVTTTYYVQGFDAVANCTTTDSVRVAVKSTAASVATIASDTNHCVSGALSLTLNPQPTPGITYQWQRNAGAGYTDITGANSSTYSETVTASGSYRANMYCDGVLVNSSTPVTVTVNNPSLLDTYDGERCDAGPVTLAATAPFGMTVKWFATATGGSPIASGSAFTTPALTDDSTFYAAAESGSGGSGASPIQITEMDLGTDRLEIQNVSGDPVDVTGWKVAVSDDYGNFTVVNAIVKTLNGIMAPGDIIAYTDAAAGPNYWGNNVLWNPGAFPTFSGWAAILDNNNNLVEFVATNWPAATIQSSTLTIGGATVSPGTIWTGDGINTTTVPATSSVSRQGTVDNNTASDFAIVPLSIGTSNPGMTLPFLGFGCTGTRVPVTASITGTPTGTGLSAGGTTTGAAQADGTTVSYTDGCGEMVATINDASGGNALGVTSAIVLTSPDVLTHNTLPYVPRAYDITPTSNGAAIVTLYALQAEFTAYNNYVLTNALTLPLLPTGPGDAAGMSNIVVTQFHGDALDGTTGPLGLYNNNSTSFIMNSNITVSWTGQYWALTFPVTGFSGFFIHTGSSPLMVSLADISAVNLGSRNRVDWGTASEAQGDHFEVERSADGSSYSKLGAVSGKGNAGTYSFMDNSPVAGVNYYRLKMMDAAGKHSYSKVVTATVKDANVFTMEAYPNPATSVLNIRTYGAAGANAKVMITDVTGKVIRTEEVVSNTATINLQGIAAGVYLVKYTDNVQSQTIRITKH